MIPAQPVASAIRQIGNHAGSSEAPSQPSEALKQPSGVVTEPSEALKKPSGVVTEASDALKKSSGVVTETSDAPTKSSGVPTEASDATTKSSGVVTEASDAPKKSSGVPANPSGQIMDSIAYQSLTSKLRCWRVAPSAAADGLPQAPKIRS